MTSYYFVAENGVTRRPRRFSAFIGCLCDNRLGNNSNIHIVHKVEENIHFLLALAATFVRNAITDLIREEFSRYEKRMTETKNGLALQKNRLDEVIPGEDRVLRIEAVANPMAKSPEKVYIKLETQRELYEGLVRIGERGIISVV